MAGTFRDLKIWQKAYELCLQIYALTNQYPSSERFNLTDQARRSATSILSNIAESHGRYHFADQIRVLYQARGEIAEVRSLLSIAHGLGYIPKQEFEKLDMEYEGLNRGQNRYIQTIYQKKSAS